MRADLRNGDNPVTEFVQCIVDRERDELEQSLASPEHQRLLDLARGLTPVLAACTSWTDVLRLMRLGGSRDADKDEILRVILTVREQDRDAGWQSVLLAVFWPGLRSLANRRRRWDPDPDELWQNVVWTFLDVVSRLDLRRRPTGLVQKIINDTIRGLYRRCRRRWRQLDHECLMANVEIDARFAMSGRRHAHELGVKEIQEQAHRRLRQALERGHIDRTDFILALASRVYGHNLGATARRLGLSYQAAKKRRQRAEAIVRRFQRSH